MPQFQNASRIQYRGIICLKRKTVPSLVSNTWWTLIDCIKKEFYDLNSIQFN